MTDIHRRAVLGAALAAAPGIAWAQARGPERAFSGGPMARNELARYFQKPPQGAPWPPSPMLDSGGRRAISDFHGRWLLLTLWAETCPPCLIEMPILARVQAKFGGPRFQVLPVVTGSTRLANVARAQKFLVDRRISNLHTLIDGGLRANELISTVTATAREPKGSLPCNLLIDPQGRLRGRQSGYVVTFAGEDAPTNSSDAIRWGRSIFEGDEADAFFKALVDGAVDEA